MRSNLCQKAAAVAAECGHDVILCERGLELGGQVRLARQLPGRDEFGGLVTNLEHEMRRADVDVRLGVAVDRALVDAEAPDTVIIATGATAYRPDHLLLDGAHVVHAVEVLDGANVGSSVVIADWRCDWVGLGIAERLAANGCHVRLAVNGTMAGQSIQQYMRDRWIGDLHRLGVEIIPYREFTSFDDAIAFVEANPDRYVIKPSGEAQNFKRLLFIGEDADGKDVVEVLEAYRKNRAAEIEVFQLQKRVTGVEIAVG